MTKTKYRNKLDSEADLSLQLSPIITNFKPFILVINQLDAQNLFYNKFI